MAHTHLNCTGDNRLEALATAERLCTENGGRFTPIRERVYDVILQSDKPVKAYDIIEQLADIGSAKPPTVYRAIDFWMELGLLHKIESLNAYVACGHMDHEHRAIFLICERCESVNELHADGEIASLLNAAKGQAFATKGVVVEMTGLCGVCAE